VLDGALATPGPAPGPALIHLLALLQDYYYTLK